ncbi:MAG: hypothetical protein CTY35_00245 [Methylotenera sp.]|uniref:toxin co-regulated pilus biosynthesis Q family protein n=1 Tax=Methylotenera sp. TaxID=2051956 RepID=UPI000D45105B|nr:toxin co-regulated pilus biosynthesis Q family protein [Methylotenera sp.]PPC84785.1 MAG: hypothetical protein CTY38_00245 [Methylotenera sp.]PPD02144.1 MAG: hypothetical protein CTY35_00245 [Methylotenera sp.]
MRKLFLLALFACSTQASAGFELIEASKLQKPKEVAVKTEIPKPAQKLAKAADVKVSPTPIRTKVLIGGLTHTGRKPAIIPPAKGFGKGLTLKESISMIVPSTFNVYNDAQLDLSRPTNWAASDGPDWVSVLDTALRAASMSATIDWTSSSISLEKQVITTPILSVQPEWLMTPKDRTVRNGMARWAKTAGWNLDWDVAVDFPIPYDVSFKGDFETAVQEVMGSLMGSDYPVEACTYENKTVRIVRFGESQRCNITR